MLASGLVRVQATPHDARLIEYLWEHTWRWLCRKPGHREFWSAAFYDLAPGVVAYSDALITEAPP
ncbi:MAG: hypothetical protein KatS3mg108_2477 [Isosphaeraceae bacterium]|jgi:hypothetical protein|nr:MAG: hypothetical protein KatS3mg108_2477 [Isosphaeraceae bacterium]